MAWHARDMGPAMKHAYLFLFFSTNEYMMDGIRKECFDFSRNECEYKKRRGDIIWSRVYQEMLFLARILPAPCIWFCLILLSGRIVKLGSGITSVIDTVLCQHTRVYSVL